MSVRIKEHKGEIVAQIPFEQREIANELKGKWKPEWNCWRFPKSPVLAYNLIQTFVNAEYDENIKNLAIEYERSKHFKNADNLSNIPNLRINAWDHQRQAYWFAKELFGAMIAADMGTGKSLVAVGLALDRIDNKRTTKHGRVLIVCPKSVIQVWPKEFYMADRDFIIAPLQQGSIQKRGIWLENRLKVADIQGFPFVTIINYESVWQQPMEKYMLKYDWDFLIMDESHRAKSPSGKASKFIYKLSRKIPYSLGLTGTPMPHSPLDIFAQYRSLDTSIFGSSYHKFKMEYAQLGGPNKNWIVGVKNKEKLSALYEKISYRVTKDILDLPEQIETYRYCELSSKTWKYYKSLDKELFAEIEAGEDKEGKPVTPANAMVKVLRLQQLTSGYLKTDDDELVHLGDEKKNLLKDVLQDIPEDEPVVIFCKFTADIANVHEVASSLKRSSSELSGAANNLESWQNGGSTILACQIKSGGVGIDLTRAAYVIYYSVGHSLGDYTQSLSRSHRPGQKRTVKYFHLLAQDTVDEKVYKALKERQEVINHIFETALYYSKK